MQKIIIAGAMLLSAFGCAAQVSGPWQGKKCAVVLTYDDAIDQQLDNAVPLLDSLGLKATFYITGFSPSMKIRMPEWKALATRGHELGNHTMFHPCASGKGREWVKADYDLRKYTFPRLIDEINSTNVLLQAMDGNTERTFAFPCADTKIGDSSYIPLLKDQFIALRNVRNTMHSLNEIKLEDVDCYMVNRHTSQQLIGWVQQAIETNSLLVILFHGVGGGSGLDISVNDHREFLQYLATQREQVWVPTMIDAAKFVRSNQKQH